MIISLNTEDVGDVLGQRNIEVLIPKFVFVYESMCALSAYSDLKVIDVYRFESIKSVICKLF